MTVIFWNLWEQMQSGQRDNGAKLQDSLGAFIKTYQPDVFGLNEVLTNRQTNGSPVLDYLKAQGYHTYFAAFSPLSEEWMIGSAVAAKQKPAKIREHRLGPDQRAHRQRGYPGHHVKAIEVHLQFGGEDVVIVVNYLAALFPLNWPTHVKHRRTYEKLLANLQHKSVTVGGDFNETKYMLPWLRLPRPLQRRTGSLQNPTWRWNGQKRRLAFANYDHLVWTNHGSLRLERFRVLPRHPSDHAPLLGVFVINKE